MLRMNEDVPANLAAARFFAAPEAPRFLGRTKITLPIVLHRNLQSLTLPPSLASLKDLNKLRSSAADGTAWKAFTQRVGMGLTRGHKRPRTTTEEQDAPPRRRLRSHGLASE